MNDHNHPAVPARVARLGEYFAMETAAGPHWRSFAELLEPETIAERVAATRAAIASSSASRTEQVPVRVAASSVQMAVAARLMSPILGAFAALRSVPLLTTHSLRWCATGHTVRLGVVELQWHDVADATEAARVIDSGVLGGVLEPLIERMHAELGLSRQVMWGNVISATNGAVTVAGMSDASLVDSGRRLVSALAETGRLGGSAAYGPSGFRRRSCCLFYQAPNGGLCGDCVLTAPSQ